MFQQKSDCQKTILFQWNTVIQDSTQISVGVLLMSWL